MTSAYTVKINPGVVRNDPINHKYLVEQAYPLTRLVIHELGHVFSYHLASRFSVLAGNKTPGATSYSPLHPESLLNSGIYEKNGEFVKGGQGGNFVTGYRNGGYDRNGGTESGYLGTDYHYYDAGNDYITGYQWHPRNMSGGNVPGEDWADIFQNWVFNSFADNNTGSAISDWVDEYMPYWLELATGKPLPEDRNDKWR